MRNTYLKEQPNKAIETKVQDSSKLGGYKRMTIFLFYVVVLYLVLPIVDVPLLGLSLSAPLLFLVAVPVFLRPPQSWFKKYQFWIFWAIAIWAGIFFSAMLNGLYRGIKIDGNVIVALIQYGYWMLIFVMTTYLLSHAEIGERISSIIAVGILLLAILRLGEVFFGGAIGYWTSLKIMTQNSYGIQFSTFGPILISYMFLGKRRIIIMFAVLVMLVAVTINGSRSSWLAILIAIILLGWMYLHTEHRPFRIIFPILFLVTALGLGLVFAPSQIISLINQRFASLQQLNEEKSFAIRQLMIQKGLRLFEQNPLMGVGVSRWYQESVPLNVPKILSFGSQSLFDSKQAHNSYVLFLAETGLMGAIPLIILLTVLVIRGYRAATKLAARDQFWALGIYAGFIGMSIHLWSLAGLTGTTPWFMYGLVAAMIEMEQYTKWQ